MSNVVAVLAFLNLLFSLPLYASTTLESFLYKHLPNPKITNINIAPQTYEEVVDELKKLPTEYFKLRYDVEGFEFVPQSHRLYQAHSKLLIEVHRGFKSTFPRMVGNAPVPTLVEVWSSSHSANIINTLKDKSAQANVVLYQIPRNEIIKSENDIRGTLAHELAHIYLRHSTMEDKNKIISFYTDRSNLIGAPITNDTQLNRLSNRWVHLASDDPLSLSELNGLPLNLFVDTNMGALFEMVLKASEFSKHEECQDLEVKYSVALAPVYQKYSRLHMDFLPFTAQEKVEIDQSTRAFVDLLYSCSKKTSLKLSLLDIIGELTGMDLSKFSVDILKENKDPDFQKLVSLLEKFPPAIAVHKMSLSIKKEMREIEKIIDVKALQHYSTEVEADEYAAIVLLNMGLSPEANFGMSLLRTLRVDPKLTIQDICIEPILRGEDIPFGSISNRHPSSCWRYSNLRKIRIEWDKLIKSPKL